MVASVPEETNRTRSTGVRATISSASSTSGSVGVPYDVPAGDRLGDPGLHLGVGVPEQHRTPGADQVDVLVAVDVAQPGAGRGADEAGGAADGVEGPDRGVHAAGGHRQRPLEERGARGGRRGRSAGHRPIVPEATNPPQSRAADRRPEGGPDHVRAGPAERERVSPSRPAGIVVTPIEGLHGTDNRRTVTVERTRSFDVRHTACCGSTPGPREQEQGNVQNQIDQRASVAATRSWPWSPSPSSPSPGPPASPRPAPGRRSPTRAPSRRLPDGTSLPTEAIEAPASVSARRRRGPRHHRRRPAGGRHRLHLRHPRRRARGLPARRDRHQLGRPGCHLSWQLIAAIGRVESDHGRTTGNTLDAQGVAPPGIFGPPLNGADGTSRIADTDAGQYDADSTWDRAVGPMQFIPSTWSVVGVDADGDGQRNPQDVDDSALATAVYLCSGGDDLNTTAGQQAAVLRYNHSQPYVDLVLSIMNAYLDGEFTSVPNGVTSAGYIVPPAAAADHRRQDRHGQGQRRQGRQGHRRAATATAERPRPRTPTTKPTHQADAAQPTHPVGPERRRPQAAAPDPDAAAAPVDLDPARSTSSSPTSRPARSACSTATSTTCSRATTRSTSACTPTRTEPRNPRSGGTATGSAGRTGRWLSEREPGGLARPVGEHEAQRLSSRAASLAQ